MGQLATVDEMVDEVERLVCDGYDLLLRTSGEVQPPTVHMFTNGSDGLYLGAVTSRRFYPGEDAAQAVVGLGELPGALGVSRVLVTWEAQDLNVALGLPVDPDASALVVLDATQTGQQLRVHPLALSRAPWGFAAVVAEWGPVRTVPDPVLATPLVALLTVWRKVRPGTVAATLERLTSAGYRMLWAPR